MLFYKDAKGKLIVEPQTTGDDVLIDAFISAINISAKLEMSKMTPEKIDAEVDKIYAIKTARGL